MYKKVYPLKKYLLAANLVFTDSERDDLTSVSLTLTIFSLTKVIQVVKTGFSV
jgi:hypothetical protein